MRLTLDSSGPRWRLENQGDARMNKRLAATLLAVLLISGCSRQDEVGSGTHATGEPAPLGPAALEALAPPEIIATGAAISGANGIHFGPDGLLYVASVMGSEIVVMDPRDGTIRRRLTVSEGVVGPDDLAFAPDGSLYWTSILTGDVSGVAASGKLVLAGHAGVGVNPITFSDDGRLFVAQCFFGDGLFELDPRGAKPPRRIADDLGPGCGLNGMDWGPDDRLYGPRWFQHEVVSFDVDSGTRRVEATGFEVPAAVKFDSRGRLHVLDTLAGRILRIEGDRQIEVAKAPPGLDNFAFDADDRLYVSSFTDGFVGRIEPDGGLTWLSPGGMAHPGGVAVFTGPAGARGAEVKPQVVVADLHSIRGFDPETGDDTFVVRNILGVGELGSVLEVAADGGDLILTSFTDNSVRVWNQHAQRITERHDGLALPVSALRYRGVLVATEHGKGRVVALDGPEPRVIVDGLEAPTGLATDGVSLFVTDRTRGEVLEVARDGAPVAARRVAGGLQAPEGIAVHGADLIVMEGQSGRVVRVRDGVVEPVALVAQGTPPASPEQPPSLIFNDVAVLGDVFYVTGETNRVLYRIDLGRAASAPADTSRDSTATGLEKSPDGARSGWTEHPQPTLPTDTRKQEESSDE
jgi:sugar lactone lactonase YvrE